MLIALDTIFQFAKLMGGGHGGPKPFFDPASAPASLLKPGLLGSHPLLQVQYSTVRYSAVQYGTVQYTMSHPVLQLDSFPRPVQGQPGDFSAALSLYTEELAR